MSAWLDLTQLGLAPNQKHQAFLGAPKVVHCGDTRCTRRALVFPHIDQFHWMDLEVLDMNCLVLYLYLSSIIKDSASFFFALAILSKIENHYPNRVIGGPGSTIELAKLQWSITNCDDPTTGVSGSRANKLEVIESNPTS